MTPRPPAGLDFIGLDPRKSKRATIEDVLRPLGAPAWRRFPPLRLKGYPETRQRAEAALAAARRPSPNALVAGLQRLLYGWQYNGSRALFARHPGAVALAWNGLNGSRRAFMDGARDAGNARLYFELAPFRGRVTCDPAGVNFVNSLPRNAEFYRRWQSETGAVLDWDGIRAGIRQRAPERPPEPAGGALPDGPFLFAPLQVPGDSQLRLFGGAFPTVPDFIAALGAAADRLPAKWHLRIKEHPSAPHSFADLIRQAGPRVVLDNQSDTFSLVARSSGVITVNSSVGLEAMFFDKPVVACGQCFWAIPGIALTAPDPATLAERLGAAEQLTFNRADRETFLTYLLDEYYVARDARDPANAQKILRRLSGAAA